MISVLEAFKDKIDSADFDSLKKSVALRDENFTQVHIQNHILRDTNDSLMVEVANLQHELEKSAIEIALLREQIQTYKKVGLDRAGNDALADLERAILLELTSSPDRSLDIDELSENLNRSPGEVELHLAYLSTKNLIHHDTSHPDVCLTQDGIAMAQTFHQLN